MRVLVTGGSGFIGGHVLRLLAPDHDVVNLDIADPGPVAATVADEVSHVRGDVTDPVDVYDAVAAHDPDRIVHLAAILVSDSREDPRRAFAVNVGGAQNVLAAAEALGVERVVAASTVNVYGRSGGERIDETTVRAPDSTYAMTKYAVEWVAAESEVETAVLEPVHGFGPDRIRGNAYDAVVVKAATSGTPIEVPRIETPDEYVYVEDTARAFVVAALVDEIGHDRYLVGSDQRASLVDVVEAVRREISDADLDLVAPDPGQWTGDRNAHPPTDTARIRADLGWEPRHTVEEMVARYVEWLREHPGAWSFDAADLPWEG